MEDGEAVACSAHAAKGMVDMRNPRCRGAERCNLHPMFGFPQHGARYKVFMGTFKEREDGLWLKHDCHYGTALIACAVWWLSSSFVQFGGLLCVLAAVIP